MALPSLDRAMEVAAYFDLDAAAARGIAAEVGRAAATWRKEAARLGVKPAEIHRMASAFEHEDLKAALRGRAGESRRAED